MVLNPRLLRAGLNEHSGNHVLGRPKVQNPKTQAEHIQAGGRRIESTWNREREE